MAAAAPAHAVTRKFTVTYRGSGTYQSDYTARAQNANGTCDYRRSESTSFDWTEVSRVALEFDRKGAVSGVEQRAFPRASRRTTSTVDSSTHGDGCANAATGYTDAGTAHCTGRVKPSAGKLTWRGAAARKRTRLELAGFLFEGLGFAGTWNYYSGSCAQNLNGQVLLLPDAAAVPRDLSVTLSVRTDTLAGLRRKRSVRVNVGPGLHAPQPAAPALRWRGEVRIRRVG